MLLFRNNQVVETESTDPTKYENDHYVLLSIELFIVIPSC